MRLNEFDPDFYREMEQRLGAAGDFARAYVMTLTGLAGQGN